MRTLTVLVAVLVLLSGCTSDRPRPGARGDGSAYSSCPGLHLDDVRGDQPSYVEGGLAAFGNDDTMCGGLWLPSADRWFVPQGLALDGTTAWVSGYRWRPRFGDRECRLLHVDLRSGRLLGSTDRVVGAVGDRRPTFCRHGGALSIDKHGLWVLETHRLWLLDRRFRVQRVWRVEDPIRGSVLVDGRPGTFDVASFADAGPGRWWRFRTADVLAPGVTALGTAAGTVRPSATGTVVRRLQGATYAGGRWQVSSTSRCGRLVTPQGRSVAFVPGAEDLAFDGSGHLWVVSESASRHYQADHRPLVPMLARFDVSRLAKGEPDSCDW